MQLFYQSLFHADDEEEFVIFEGDIILSSNEMKRMRMSTPLDEDIDDLSAVDLRSKRKAEPMGSGMRPSQELTPSDSKAVVSRVWPNCEVPFKYDQRLRKCGKQILTAAALWSWFGMQNEVVCTYTLQDLDFAACMVSSKVV